MKAQLKNMTRKELERLKTDIEKALGKISDREKKMARDAAEKAAAAFGFSLTELTDGSTTAKKRGPKPAKAPAAPKYANPADATQTWTGKGRQPQWFKDAVGAGTAPEALEI